MRKVSEYREHAEECMRMVRRTNDPDHKKRLIEMAEAWTMLANERTAQLAKQAANGNIAAVPADNDRKPVKDKG